MTAMRRYEELEHTADLKIRIHGQDREELFRNASWALAELLVEVGEPVPGSERTLNLPGAADYSLLLVDFMSELLYLWEAEGLVFIATGQLEVSLQGVSATLEAFEPKAYRQAIKAVTYHGLEIEDTEGGFQAKIIFDI